MKHSSKLLIAAIIAVASCKKNDNNSLTPEPEFFVNEDPATFAEIGKLKVGGAAAAEISAYDSITQRLFVVNNEGTDGAVNRIDVVDLKNPANPAFIRSISMAPYGGAVNSLSVHNSILAAAIQSTNKTDNGKVALLKTTDYSEIKSVTVGALPDMVTISPDGKFIMTANEGEPNADYSIDPKGSISIIEAENNYAVTTLYFDGFASQATALKAKGFRIFGPQINPDFASNIEPEYITISADSKTAWVTLQENNAIAKVNITGKAITDIFPLGFKDYSLAGNEIDPSDKDNGYKATTWNVKGIYMPDAIAVLEQNNIPYLFTANEGDAREYIDATEKEIFVEAKRIGSKNVILDPTVFPNAADLKKETALGRLNITTTLGDKDGDGDFDELYSFGARSFSVWNGLTGAQVFDSKNELDVKVNEFGTYDDGRSDDKSVEPEGITIGKVGKTNVAFVGMERVDAVAMYDITNPQNPRFLQLVKTGDAPEGVLFVPARMSPTKKSLLIVSSEGDGMVTIYTPKTI
ncbi:choice-of-anchor I family protein [Niabella yanshanensis]|uniref:Choice-of-anchor I family protein n=1 Tax=Niabella yanshanensis TaxID=577386 RepID=A0ABZ0W832_9BACT|nr:choice-of-anchor I family protein [Niabella yanshanensis]WQD38824.1 choice-of-anchor I family protein [Niabella yanshanensis]